MGCLRVLLLCTIIVYPFNISMTVSGLLLIGFTKNVRATVSPSVLNGSRISKTNLSSPLSEASIILHLPLMMAQLLRTSKSARDWTANELYAYNITVVPQNKEAFFDTTDFTEPSLPGFMVAETRQDARDKRTRQLLHYLELAMDPKSGHETAVVNFAAELLKSLKYDDEDSIVFTQRTIPFLTCGKNSVAQIDVCVIDEDGMIMLLLQEDKRLTNMNDPEAQVIAAAIATYAFNNRKRERDLNLPGHKAIILPCLTMTGSTPVFYQILISGSLLKAVQTGTYPETETRVHRFIPALPRGNSEGMRPLANRLEILRCLGAFKRFFRL